jgi:hypothetical protein
MSQFVIRSRPGRETDLRSDVSCFSPVLPGLTMTKQTGTLPKTYLYEKADLFIGIH